MMGLKIPMGVDKSGGAAIIDGDENDAQIISVALSSGDNENAFQQDISLDEAMVFDLNDPIIRAKITRKLYKIFDEFRLRKRFKLLKNTMIWNEDSSNQELTLEFKYVNLESDEEVLFRKTYTSAG